MSRIWIAATRHAPPGYSGLPDRWLVCEIDGEMPPAYQTESDCLQWILFKNYDQRYVKPIDFILIDGGDDE